jgi:hypothetical protein
MRVKLCSRCPHTRRDLAGHSDPEAALQVCAKRCGEQEANTSYNSRRRQQCVTAPNIPGKAQPTAALSATESLASYGNIPAEQPFVQRSALTASRHARKATADGYAGFTPPESGWDEIRTATFPSLGFRKGACAGPVCLVKHREDGKYSTLGGAT